MKPLQSTRICLVPRLSGVGGMVSFQYKLAQGLVTRGIEVCYDLADLPYDAVLVIGGTRHIGGLWRVRRRGIPIVQRLDGMNWVHRVHRSSLRHFVRAEYGNILLKFIRTRLVDRVVYQSQFVHQWWERVHGPTPVENSVIYNGVDLNVYTPFGIHNLPSNRIRLLMVEGNMMGGYEMGLENGVQLAMMVAGQMGAAHSHNEIKPVELMVVGRVNSDLRARLDKRITHQAQVGFVSLNWSGVVQSKLIPEIDRSAHLLYSADINAACPNSVIEALACGTPVLGFNTGALPELVKNGAGRIVPYGGDPWELESPDIQGLAQACEDIIKNQKRFRTAARARAEDVFGLDEMVDQYLEILLDG